LTIGWHLGVGFSASSFLGPERETNKKAFFQLLECPSKQNMQNRFWDFASAVDMTCESRFPIEIAQPNRSYRAKVTSHYESIGKRLSLAQLTSERL
jgi:hypothetical protein